MYLQERAAPRVRRHRLVRVASAPFRSAARLCSRGHAACASAERVPLIAARSCSQLLTIGSFTASQPPDLCWALKDKSETDNLSNAR